MSFHDSSNPYTLSLGVRHRSLADEKGYNGSYNSTRNVQLPAHTRQHRAEPASTQRTHTVTCPSIRNMHWPAHTRRGRGEPASLDTQHATPDTSAFQEIQPDVLWLAGTLGPDEAAQLRESTRDWGAATLSAVLATKTSLVHAVFGRSDPGFVEQFKGRVCSGVMFLRRPSRADKTHDVQLIVADWGGARRHGIYQPELRRSVDVYYTETVEDAAWVRTGFWGDCMTFLEWAEHLPAHTRNAVNRRAAALFPAPALDLSGCEERIEGALWRVGKLRPEEARALLDTVANWHEASSASILAAKTSIVALCYPGALPGFAAQFEGGPLDDYTCLDAPLLPVCHDRHERTKLAAVQEGDGVYVYYAVVPVCPVFGMPVQHTFADFISFIADDQPNFWEEFDYDSDQYIHSDSDGDGNEYYPFLAVEPGDTGQRASEHTISRRYKSKEYAISRQKYKHETEYGTGGSRHARRTRRGPAAAAEHDNKTARGPEHSSRPEKTQMHRWTLRER